MKLLGNIKVDDVEFSKELDLSNMDEDAIDKAVHDYMEGMRATILNHLQVGDYNPNRND